jgi:hypothetical protein
MKKITKRFLVMNFRRRLASIRFSTTRARPAQKKRSWKDFFTSVAAFFKHQKRAIWGLFFLWLIASAKAQAIVGAGREREASRDRKSNDKRPTAIEREPISLALFDSSEQVKDVSSASSLQMEVEKKQFGDKLFKLTQENLLSDSENINWLVLKDELISRLEAARAYHEQDAQEDWLAYKKIMLLVKHVDKQDLLYTSLTSAKDHSVPALEPHISDARYAMRVCLTRMHSPSVSSEFSAFYLYRMAMLLPEHLGNGARGIRDAIEMNPYIMSLYWHERDGMLSDDKAKYYLGRPRVLDMFKGFGSLLAKYNTQEAKKFWGKVTAKTSLEELFSTDYAMWGELAKLSPIGKLDEFTSTAKERIKFIMATQPEKQEEINEYLIKLESTLKNVVRQDVPLPAGYESLSSKVLETALPFFKRYNEAKQELVSVFGRAYEAMSKARLGEASNLMKLGISFFESLSLELRESFVVYLPSAYSALAAVSWENQEERMFWVKKALALPYFNHVAQAIYLYDQLPQDYFEKGWDLLLSVSTFEDDPLRLFGTLSKIEFLSLSLLKAETQDERNSIIAQMFSQPGPLDKALGIAIWLGKIGKREEQQKLFTILEARFEAYPKDFELIQAVKRSFTQADGETAAVSFSPEQEEMLKKLVRIFKEDSEEDIKAALIRWQTKRAFVFTNNYLLAMGTTFLVVLGRILLLNSQAKPSQKAKPQGQGAATVQAAVAQKQGETQVKDFEWLVNGIPGCSLSTIPKRKQLVLALPGPKNKEKLIQLANGVWVQERILKSFLVYVLAGTTVSGQIIFSAEQKGVSAASLQFLRVCDSLIAEVADERKRASMLSFSSVTGFEINVDHLLYSKSLDLTKLQLLWLLAARLERCGVTNISLDKGKNLLQWKENFVEEKFLVLTDSDRAETIRAVQSLSDIDVSEKLKKYLKPETPVLLAPLSSMPLPTKSDELKTLNDLGLGAWVYNGCKFILDKEIPRGKRPMDGQKEAVEALKAKGIEKHVVATVEGRRLLIEINSSPEELAAVLKIKQKLPVVEPKLEVAAASNALSDELSSPLLEKITFDKVIEKVSSQLQTLQTPVDVGAGVFELASTADASCFDGPKVIHLVSLYQQGVLSLISNHLKCVFRQAYFDEPQLSHFFFVYHTTRAFHLIASFLFREKENTKLMWGIRNIFCHFFTRISPENLHEMQQVLAMSANEVIRFCDLVVQQAIGLQDGAEALKLVKKALQDLAGHAAGLTLYANLKPLLSIPQALPAQERLFDVECLLNGLRLLLASQAYQDFCDLHSAHELGGVLHEAFDALSLILFRLGEHLRQFDRQQLSYEELRTVKYLKQSIGDIWYKLIRFRNEMAHDESVESLSENLDVEPYWTLAVDKSIEIANNLAQVVYRFEPREAGISAGCFFSPLNINIQASMSAAGACSRSGFAPGPG